MNSQVQMMDLPTEVLKKIFSYIPDEDLYYSVAKVCTRFKAIAMDPKHSEKIEVDNEVPSDTLRVWIRTARRLRQFTVRSRNGANFIADEFSRSCMKVESIQLINCWGSTTNYFIHSTPLCNLVTRCQNLRSFNLTQCRFLSCKFFKLLSRYRPKRRGIKKCNYTGPIACNQMKALFDDLSDQHDISVIPDTVGNVSLKHRLKMRDVVRFISNDHDGDGDIIHDIWDNLKYGNNAILVGQNIWDMDIDE